MVIDKPDFKRLTIDPFALQQYPPADLLTYLSEVWGTPVAL